MIGTAWDEYRGWAKRARELQEESGRWTGLAMLFAILAAVLGAAAGQANMKVELGRVLAFLAAACAAITPILGQDILAVGREAGWIRARATAESIKSECYRFAARAGEYSAAGAVELFRGRRDKIMEAATRAGLAAAPDPADADERRPPEPVTAAWYLDHRLRDQKLNFYAKGWRTNEQWSRRLRYASLGAAVLGAVIGAASATFEKPGFAPWIGVLTTLGAMLVAYGLLERRQYLAVSYGAMFAALGRIEESFALGQLDLAGLVTATEDLLMGEHAAWTDRMTKTIAVPPQPAAKQVLVGRSSETG